MIPARILALLLVAPCFAAIPVSAQTLEKSLLAESAAKLAGDARQLGDAKRGAIVFHQPYMSCRKCHDSDDPDQQLGPDLSRWPDKPATDEQLVDAILRPSKEIRDGYQSLTVLTDDGQTVVGLIVQRGEQIVLRDPSQPARLHRFDADTLEAVQENKNSLMPQSLVNQLSSRQQFLDLIRYLVEIRDGGPLAARNLKPAPHLYAAKPLPEYEKTIDHAGMIADLGRENFKRGEAIYRRLCVNCHGTVDQPGSLPTSLRFASGKFKNGSDPYTMYQTLTRGFGMMQPQTWMVPQQKYDVVHYIREAYLKKHNPSQYFAIDQPWLASLPRGDSRGPSPQNLESWVTMDYGRTLVNTYEVGSDGSNFAYKGIAVRLDQGPGGVSRGRHWMIFDHDTLRMAAAWSGDRFIDWKGIHFNGQHAIHPRIAGQLQVENKTGPGWANPSDGSWEDPRIIGRDDRRYGPLPRRWGQYEGMYYHGNETVIQYRLGATSIHERPQLLAESPRPIYARQIDFGSRPQPLTLQVADVAGDDHRLNRLSSAAVLFGSQADSVTAEASPPLRLDGSSYAQIDQAAEFDMTSKSFTIKARIKTRKGGSLFAKTDDAAQWVPDGKVFFVRGGKLCYDIGWVGAVQSKARVNDGRWHDVALTWDRPAGVATLFVDGNKSGERQLRPKASQENQVVRLGFCATDFPGPHSHFEGQIESLQFFPARLSAGQIAGREDSPSPLADWNLASSESVVRNRAADKHHARILRGESSADSSYPLLVAGITSEVKDVEWTHEKGKLRLTVPAGRQPASVMLWFAAVDSADEAQNVDQTVAGLAGGAEGNGNLLGGGAARNPEVLTTAPSLGGDEGPLAVDVLTRPEANPWLARVRLTGFDFFADGDSAAVCSWDGDVWRVTGIGSLGSNLQWKRMATGLFQPLGVRIVDGDIYVTCRDQIVILRDKNDDGETDFFECFNNDHQVTDHFHEFAMGLQTDAEGNFYYAKSARHALTALVPHHGTLLRVSKDGKRTDIVANGFRAANGVCLNPDGSFIVTDQEGHWNPKNRINWVREGGFYGNMFGYHEVTDSSDSAMQQPLCWITNNFDRSPAELLWVPKDCWGPLGGSLLNLSYGYGKIFVVPHEEVDGQMQGGMCELPMPQFPTGLVRGRFHPTNGHLYTCGMFAWAGNQQQPGGFYRIRATGKPMHLPIGLNARKGSVTLRFTDPLSPKSAQQPNSYNVTAWDLKRTAKYGSKHYNERSWQVQDARLSTDGKTVTLTIPEIEPTWGMEIRCFLQSLDGKKIERRIHNTIHQLKDKG